MVLERLKKLIFDQTGIDADDIKESDSFLDDLGMDSLDVIEIVFFAESEFNISIEDEEIANIKTVADAVELIRQKTE